MRTATRRIEFDAGHRVLGHGGRCRFIHGHRYRAEVTVQAADLDGLGMVVDFAVVKQRVGAWVDAHLDHNLLLHQDDPLHQLWQQISPENWPFDALFGGRTPYVMPAGNPTAENLAWVIFEATVILLPPTIEVVRVRLFETPNCWADYQPAQPEKGRGVPCS